MRYFLAVAAILTVIMLFAGSGQRALAIRPDTTGAKAAMMERIRVERMEAGLYRSAPLFTAADTKGETVRLSDFKGKIVVLEWTNHECPFVKKHYESGNMQALQKEAAEKGIIWLSIVSSAAGKQGYVTPQQADEITQQSGAAPYATILDADGAIGKLYGAKTTPHMFIVDPGGALVYTGAIDNRPDADPASVSGAYNYVKSAMVDVWAGQIVGNPLTQPYGCSVKYGE